MGKPKGKVSRRDRERAEQLALSAKLNKIREEKLAKFSSEDEYGEYLDECYESAEEDVGPLTPEEEDAAERYWERSRKRAEWEYYHDEPCPECELE